MKNVLRRSTQRVMRALLRSFEERTDAQHQRLVDKIERLEKRVDAAMAKSQSEARLLASRSTRACDIRRGETRASSWVDSPDRRCGGSRSPALP